MVTYLLWCFQRCLRFRILPSTWVQRQPTNGSFDYLEDSHPSPLKAVTIPRLELMGAVPAPVYPRTLSSTLKVSGVKYWTDSMNVLYWIQNQSRTFKPFVANCVAQIQWESNPDQWRHIPGEINPANLPTRGLAATKLCHNDSWMCGPNFLTNGEPWPERLPSKSPPNDGGEEESENPCDEWNRSNNTSSATDHLDRTCIRTNDRTEADAFVCDFG